MAFDETPVNTQNRDARIACVILADVSGSMSGAPIQALEAGYRAFIDEVQSDPLARKRAEIAVVTFGSTARVLVPFQEARELQPVSFGIDGSTNMADGIQLALDEIEARKAQYRAENLEYFRPWLWVMTDGEPDARGFDEAIRRLNDAEAAKRVTVFPVGVGDQVNWSTLGRVSAEREAIKLDGLKFSEMFRWLSHSLSSVSQSANFGRDDASLDKGEQIALSPVGWATV